MTSSFRRGTPSSATAAAANTDTPARSRRFRPAGISPPQGDASLVVPAGANQGIVEDIYAFLRAAPIITPERLCTTWVRVLGLTGTVSGNSTEQRIAFHSGGRFEYHSEGTSYGIFHTDSSRTDLAGSWKLVGEHLPGAADEGEFRTFTLEPRTEAGSNATAIAIDGTRR